jgi:hypothetical protein
MLNGDPPLASSDVLHYALDEGLNMIFEEGLESARRRKGPKAMGLQPLPQTPHAPPHSNCLHGPGRPQALRRQVDRLGEIQRHVGQTGGLGAQTGPYGRPGVLRPPRASPLDAGHDAGRSRPQGRRRRRPEDLPPDRSSSPTPRGQHPRGVSAEGNPWIEPPYRRCWLGPPPGELQILRRFSTDSPRARRRCRHDPPPRCPQAGVGYIGPEAQDRRRGVLSSAAAGA